MLLHNALFPLMFVALFSVANGQDPSSLDEAQKLLSDIQRLRNDSNQDSFDPLANYSSDEELDSGNFTDEEYSGRKDMTGHYNNLKFGIADFVIPQGWYASEFFEGTNGVFVEIQQGTEQEMRDKLIQTPIDSNSSVIMPRITVGSFDKKEHSQVTSIFNQFSSPPVCTSTVPNSTALIDGKTFSLSSMECKLYPEPIDNQLSTSQDSISTDFIRTYEYETPDRLFSVELLLNTQDIFSGVNKKVDVTSYFPALDSVANSFKVK